MGEDKSLRDTVAEWTIGAAAVIGVGNTLGEAAIARADLSDPVKDSAIVAVENFDNAFSKAAVGIQKGEDAANASPVPEPEAADHSDPPEPSESSHSFEVGSGWAEQSNSGWAEQPDSGWAEQPDSGWADQAEGDWADQTEPPEAAGDVGEGVQ